MATGLPELAGPLPAATPVRMVNAQVDWAAELMSDGARSRAVRGRATSQEVKAGLMLPLVADRRGEPGAPGTLLGRGPGKWVSNWLTGPECLAKSIIEVLKGAW